MSEPELYRRYTRDEALDLFPEIKSHADSYADGTFVVLDKTRTLVFVDLAAPPFQTVEQFIGGEEIDGPLACLEGPDRLHWVSAPGTYVPQQRFPGHFNDAHLFGRPGEGAYTYLGRLWGGVTQIYDGPPGQIMLGDFYPSIRPAVPRSAWAAVGWFGDLGFGSTTRTTSTFWRSSGRISVP